MPATAGAAVARAGHRAAARPGRLAHGVGQRLEVVAGAHGGVVVVGSCRTTSQPRGTVSRAAWPSHRS